MNANPEEILDPKTVQRITKAAIANARRKSSLINKWRKKKSTSDGQDK